MRPKNPQSPFFDELDKRCRNRALDRISQRAIINIPVCPRCLGGQVKFWAKGTTAPLQIGCPKCHMIVYSGSCVIEGDK
jgi:hypothetical protein